MPKKQALLSINLLPGEEAKFGEKFLEWSLTFGRYIIIGTEIIVLVAFLSRFKFDRDLIDLNDKVKERQKVLESYKPVEENVLRLQKRLTTIAALEANQGSGILALPDIASITPPQITYQNILVSQDKVTIVGQAIETADISTFVATLKASTIFKKETINLEKVERGKTENNQLAFTVTALVEKKGQEK